MLRLALFLAALLAGCTFTDSSHVLVGDARDPIDPSAVRIYHKPPANYEEIALVSSEAEHGLTSDQALTNAALEEIKKEAAKLGANGVLLQRIGNQVTGSSTTVAAPYNSGYAYGVGTTTTSTKKVIQGTAIYVAE